MEQLKQKYEKLRKYSEEIEKNLEKEKNKIKN